MENLAILFRRARQAVIEDMQLPELKKNELLIKTQKTLISTGTELTAFSGDCKTLVRKSKIKNEIDRKYFTIP